MYSVATKANEPTATDKTASHDGPRDAGSMAGIGVVGSALSPASDGLPDGLRSCWASIDVLRFGEKRSVGVRLHGECMAADHYCLLKRRIGASMGNVAPLERAAPGDGISSERFAPARFDEA